MDLTLSRLAGTLKNTFKIGKATLDASGIATARTIVVQNKAGTLALTSDLITSLSVFTHAQTVVTVDLSTVYLPVLNRSSVIIYVPLA